MSVESNLGRRLFSRDTAEDVLVDAAVVGDKDAMNVLFARHHNYLFGVAYHVLKNPDIANEALQDAFLKIFLYVGKFDKQASFRTWASKVVYHRAFDVKRKLALAGQSYDFDDAIDGDRLERGVDGQQMVELIRQRMREAMGKALEGLTEKHREALLLRELEGLSYEEIADILDIAKGTVMSRLHHGRAQFVGGYKAALNGDSVRRGINRVKRLKNAK